MAMGRYKQHPTKNNQYQVAVMSNIQTEQLADRVVLRIHGDFTFDINRTFREAYQAHASGSNYEVDLSRTNYMDSSGLGMLIQLREYAGGDNGRVILSGARPTIQSILEVAKFSRLFEIQ